MKYINEVDVAGNIVILRVDFNVPLTPALTVADDQRIRASIPTITYLLERNCKVVIVSHLGRPEGVTNKLSLEPVVAKLQELLPHKKVSFLHDLSKASKSTIAHSENSLFLLENIRFYKEEQENDAAFAERLSSLGDIFVNDAFSVSHRADASVVGITKFLPSYGGLLLKKELSSLERLLHDPAKPFVAILGGSKISTKLGLIEKLSDLVNTIIVGGGIANTFLLAQGYEIGKSICEKDMVDKAKELTELCKSKSVTLLLPTDIISGDDKSRLDDIDNRLVSELGPEDNIFDIGPQTRDRFTSAIQMAKTIVWNGPVGYFENPTYQAGTDAIYTAITTNNGAFSVAGGGDTLSYLGSKPENDKISFVSTGGGAMLEYLAKGTLPGVDALSSSP